MIKTRDLDCNVGYSGDCGPEHLHLLKAATMTIDEFRFDVEKARKICNEWDEDPTDNGYKLLPKLVAACDEIERLRKELELPHSDRAAIDAFRFDLDAHGKLKTQLAEAQAENERLRKLVTESADLVAKTADDGIRISQGFAKERDTALAEARRLREALEEIVESDAFFSVPLRELARTALASSSGSASVGEEG